MAHPVGIQPEGNLLLVECSSSNIRDEGLGNLHVLGDGLILELLQLLEARDLAALARTSKALYCFCDAEDIWKGLVLVEFEGEFKWEGTWRRTYIATAVNRRAGATPSSIAIKPDIESPSGNNDEAGSVKEGKGNNKKRGSKQGGKAAKKQKGGKKGDSSVPGKGQRGALSGPSRLQVSGFYSDLLYQPWHCATCELSPEWLEVDNIDRVKSLSADEFFERYELANRPCLIVDGAKEWPALKKWNQDYLVDALTPNHPVIAGNMRMPLSTYLDYANNNTDEQPLYLFDKACLGECAQLAADFSVPSVFGHDLMEVMGDSRPDYRWLIVGPHRSGSSFHVDPNATNAWNAMVTGRKKWIMFPPHMVPPGVHPSEDGADVATPVSLVEWFLNFYDDARACKVAPIECVAKPGEVVFVPRGWWHACLNLDSLTIAVTQNFVSPANLGRVLDFLRPGRVELVSGCKEEDRATLHERFVSALRQHKPQVLADLEAQRASRKKKAEEQHRLASLFKAPSAPAEVAEDAQTQPSAAAVPETGGASFSFGFSFGK